jgi:hypothetical protein
MVFILLNTFNLLRLTGLPRLIHFMRKDFENKLLLFPYFDTASLEMAAIDDQQMEEEGKLKFDSLENVSSGR